MILGGQIYQKKVMRYDWNTSQWTYQEDMNYGHFWASCSIFNSPKHGYRHSRYTRTVSFSYVVVHLFPSWLVWGWNQVHCECCSSKIAHKIALTCLTKKTIGAKSLLDTRGISIQGEVRHVWISRATQQLLCSKSHDFLAVFALAHSKTNQIA